MKTYNGFFGRVPMLQHSLAGRVLWDPHSSIGDAALDAQDQTIFGLVGEIHDLWRHSASVAQLRVVADKTSGVLDAHFRCEERMLAKVGYPRIARHAAEHHEMLEDLESIRAFLDGGGGRLRAGYAGLRLSNFILGVTVGHILNTDSDYCKYIADETEKQSTGCA